MRGALLRASVALACLRCGRVAARRLVNPNFLPPASDVVRTLWRLLVSGELLRHAWVSLERILLGLAVSILVGVPLGIFMGSWKTFERTLDGPLQAGRQVSAIALFPCSSCSSESANCPRW